MIRYLKLYMRLLEFSFGKAMEFRIDFYFRVFMDLMFYFVSFAFFKIAFQLLIALFFWPFDKLAILIRGRINFSPHFPFFLFFKKITLRFQGPGFKQYFRNHAVCSTTTNNCNGFNQMVFITNDIK